ncbi:ATP phosphoribosyltransferase regulatory subunit [Proteus terrae]|uniref:Eco57I restriction-modification methylase domain-containing protein n=2 Tax=Enterobacterales TaxID=91347 RepID=UPI0018C5A56A|nr:DNA methyltransferase [Proteus terrae]MBG5949431.1 ATP phosphoribosyltransferase regulatory subunit [Proteus terrae]
MSLTNIHAEWLSLVDISGPFLAIPVLTHTFPQGLEELSSFKRRRLRQAYDEWREALELEDPQLEELHSAWIDEVLSRVLEFDDDGKGDVLKRAEWCGSHLKSLLPDQGVVQYPDLAVVDEQQDNKPLLLIHTYKPNVDLESTVKQEGWITTPADRMVQLCRSLDCRLGLVTNGERWMLVDAPVGAVTSFSSWYARLWSLEPITLQAFVHLLGIRRFFVDETEQLPALFDASLEYQDDVTDALGEQVCRAVEVLIQSLDKADQDRNRELLCDVSESELYEAALTVMMRLVFLLSAEERGLLLLGDECYESNYAISTLRMQLRQEPSEILERRWDAWTRLLATFRAVYCGIEHENLRLSTLGSSLFDPDHFPFLEGRAKGSDWKTDIAIPLPIDNRTVLLLLEAIQLFQGRTLSYRALDVEQIGYVYEGLLERTVKRTNEVTLQLDATRKAKSPWISLAELESANIESSEYLVELLKERSGSTVSRVRKMLAKKADDTLADRLLTTCQGDMLLRDRIKPYVHLLQTDPWGYPLVYPAKSFIITSGSNRRETGTHYTPKSLTEAIVAETLTPIVYIGPTEGYPREEWKLKPASELLNLKICDPAMGSGAFLVQTCRWLAERLVEAWFLAEKSGSMVSANGEVLESLGRIEPLPLDFDTRVIIARGLIAERCLYGVDLNPLAVELAKLSIWLVTLAKGRPFGFLDHNLRHGDSLLGIHQLDQLTQFSIHPSQNGQLRQFSQKIELAVLETIELRQKLRDITIRDINDVNAMVQLNAKAHRKLEMPQQIANIFIGEAFTTSLNSKSFEHALDLLTVHATQAMEGEIKDLDVIYQKSLASFKADMPANEPIRRPFHWPLEFPEVFVREDSGFDSIVGNPPFLGGKRISTISGDNYSNWLSEEHLGAGKNTDLVAHFFRRAWNILRNGGSMGLLATNSIAEGDTRKGGLEWLLNHGAIIYSAYPNEPWAGQAAVITSRVHIYKGQWNGERRLIGNKTTFISAFLSDREEWSPKRLKANEGKAFIGSYVLGMGFVLPHDEAIKMLEIDSRNYDVITPYLNGEDLNSDPEQRPSRWVINFWDWSEEKASLYKEPFSWIKEKVFPERLNKSKEKSYRDIMSMWWLFWRHRPELYHAIGRGHYFERHPEGWSSKEKSPSRVLAVTRVSKTLAFSFVDPNITFSDATVIFTQNRGRDFAVLQSSFHAVYAWQHASRLKADLRYSPTDALEPFAFPNEFDNEKYFSLDDLGDKLHEARNKIMMNDRIGLTKLYNRFHTKAEHDSCIEELRELQYKMDTDVARAYGWGDLELDHDFHKVSYLPENDRVRFTISEAARVEVLKRLSELNRLRYQDEVDAGLHDKSAKNKSLKNH